MKMQIINSIGSFTLGGGVALVGLLSWTGTTDLQAIKDSVQNYVVQSEDELNTLVSDYQIVVDNANTEISEYQDALAQANDNISTLITKYEEQQAQAEQDLEDLQTELDGLYARLDQQYEEDMNQVIEEANAEIAKANEEVAQAKEEVNEIIDGSHAEDIISSIENIELNTDGDKTVQDISGIVPQE